MVDVGPGADRGGAGTGGLAIGRQLLGVHAIAVVAFVLFAFFGLRTLDRLDGSWRALSERGTQKLALLERLQSSLGYGGMIHHLKNYVLRGDEVYAEWFWDDMAAARLVLEEYGDLEALSPGEREDLRLLAGMLDQYSGSMERLADGGIDTAERDGLARVDDTPFFAAMDLLRRRAGSEFAGSSGALSAELAQTRQVLTVLGLVGGGAMLFGGTPLLIWLARRLRAYVAERAEHEAYLGAAKERAEAVAAENVLLAAAVTASVEPVVVVDSNGLVRIANRAAEELASIIGQRREAGELALVLRPECVGDRVAAALRGAVREGRAIQARVEVDPDPDVHLPVLGKGAVHRPETVWLEVTVSPIQGASGQPDGAAISERDVTGSRARERSDHLRAEGSEAYARIARVMGEDRPLEERLEEAVGVVLSLEQLEVEKKGGVFLFEEGDDRLRMSVTVGQFSDAFLRDESEVMLGSCLCGRAALSGELIVSDNCFEDERHEHAWPSMTPHGHYIVPLNAGGKTVGVLFLYTDVNPSHDEARLDALRHIGSILAHAILRERVSRQIRAANTTMRTAQERFELALAGSRDAIFDWDRMTDEIFLAPRWAELLGTSEVPTGRGIGTLLSRVAPARRDTVEAELTGFLAGDEAYFESEFQLVREDSRTVWVLCRAAASRDENGVARRVSGSVADISRIKQAESTLQRLVHTDALTGLASRVQLLEQVESGLARSRAGGGVTAVLFFDFDRFKVVNDSLGHDTGDALLRGIAGRLTRNLRDGDTAARFGGDEFVVVLEGLPDDAAAYRIGEKLLGVCSAPYEINGHSIVSTASIGLVTSSLGYDDPAAMIRDADAAMYQAKAAGRGRVVVFDTTMHAAALDRLNLEAELRQATASGQFELAYQPIVELESGQVAGAEALCRWVHPERGRVSPEVFIAIAEDANLIQEIGSWVIAQACTQLADWRARGTVEPGFRLSVNVSKAQLLTPGFAQEFLDVLRRHDLAPDALKLEVTETTLVDNRSDVAQVLRDLRDRDVTVVMDDFGTGHSSLSGLDALPVDELKIDQSFVRRAEANKDLIAIISAITTLADHLSLGTVGEGIETPDQISLLQSIGCQHGQGYLFGEPMAPGAFEAYLRGARAKRAA